MEIPRLGVKSELQLLAYATATATRDPSHVCDLHTSSWQSQILNPLNKARDRTCILINAGRVHNPLSHNGDSILFCTMRDAGEAPECDMPAGQWKGLALSSHAGP